MPIVDSHVGKFIFENILHSETGILRKKTRILVTNNLAVLPYTDSIIVMKEGEIIELGSYNELLRQNNYFANLIQQYAHSESDNKDNKQSEEDKLADKSKDAANFNFKINKLVEKEETQTGRVKWSVYWRYLQAVTLFWWAIVTANYILSQVSSAGSSVWLSVWSRQAENDNSNAFYYLVLYGKAIHSLWGGLLYCGLIIARCHWHQPGSVQCSRMVLPDKGCSRRCQAAT